MQSLSSIKKKPLKMSYLSQIEGQCFYLMVAKYELFIVRNMKSVNPRYLILVNFKEATFAY